MKHESWRMNRDTTRTIEEDAHSIVLEAAPAFASTAGYRQNQKCHSMLLSHDALHNNFLRIWQVNITTARAQS